MGTGTEALTRNGYAEGVDKTGCVELKSSAYVIPVSRREFEETFNGDLDAMLAAMIDKNEKLMIINRGKAAKMTDGGVDEAKAGLLGGKLAMLKKLYKQLDNSDVLSDSYMSLKSSPSQEKFDFALQILPALNVDQINKITDVILSFINNKMKRKKLREINRKQLAKELFEEIQATYDKDSVTIPEDEDTMHAILRYFDAVQGLFTEKQKKKDIIRECKEELFEEQITIGETTYSPPLAGLSKKHKKKLLCRKNFLKVNTAFPHYIVDTVGTDAGQDILKVTQAELYVLLMDDDAYDAWKKSEVVKPPSHAHITSTAERTLKAVGSRRKFSVSAE